jgi:hypothetical protein
MKKTWKRIGEMCSACIEDSERGGTSGGGHACTCEFVEVASRS